jgi:hypothetical protein
MKEENGVLICVDVPFSVREDETISLLLLLLHLVRADVINISSRGRSPSCKATRRGTNAPKSDNISVKSCDTPSYKCNINTGRDHTFNPHAFE